MAMAREHAVSQTHRVKSVARYRTETLLSRHLKSSQIYNRIYRLKRVFNSAALFNAYIYDVVESNGSVKSGS
jgi:hypothetical protein